MNRRNFLLAPFAAVLGAMTGTPKTCECELDVPFDGWIVIRSVPPEPCCDDSPSLVATTARRR